MKKVFASLVLSAFLLTILVTAAFAARSNPNSSDVNQMLAEARAATARYHDYRVALAEGFVNTELCVAAPGLGAMGVHFIHLPRIIDPAINHTEPEILLYEPLPNDGYRLVGIEYMYAIGGPDQPVPSNPPPAPYLYGVPFNGPMAAHGPGEPPHYDLHTWVWQPNPSGTFAQFNPNVNCP